MRKYAVGLLVLVLLWPSVPASAWGPQSQIAIVTTAGRMLSKEGAVPLSKMEKEIQQGASLTSGELGLLMSNADLQPARSIFTEMLLLQAVRESGVDPYFAFRLGALGKVVAGVTAPMQAADPVHRKMYYDDIDQRISDTGLTLQARQMVDSMEYFTRINRELEERQNMLLTDYRSGLGFDGVAKSTYGQDLSRSINAVGDVWYTVLQRRGVSAGVSHDQKRNYVLRAMAFYVDRANLGEINAAHKRLQALDVYTSDVLKEIGDMMYEAGMRERAVEEYLAVLKKEPERKDVVRRIADYYIDLADEELERERLETARDYYARALEVDPLHPLAESKRLTAERLIRERDARLAQARDAIAKARELEENADVQASTKRYAEAIAQLRQALDFYRGVTNEFVVEKRAAQAGVNNVTSRMRELRIGLQESASGLSGAGSSVDTANLAERESENQRAALYKSMVEQAYEQELQRQLPQVDLRVRRKD
ncbi:MAG: tetratricopeptide repeat protein [Candidatus Hydrogenedentales bacterium]|jgi:tetratricopeptide (TPR) repeat protein